ncbi:fasciclin domain-containing protein [Telluribacter humicola]
MMVVVLGCAVVLGANAQTTTGKDLAGSAALSENHTTLLAALKAAGLADQASSQGPYTVFAPTNSAFSALPSGTVDNLLKPENKKMLSGILLYHVVQGSVMSSDLKDGQAVTTIQGDKLTVRMKDGKVMLEDAKGNMATVTTADIKATNGVVHSIDTVLMPSK